MKILSNLDLNNDSQAKNAINSVDAQDYVTRSELPVTNTDVILAYDMYTSEDNSSGTGRLSWGNGSTDVGSGAVVLRSGTIRNVGISTGAAASNQNINLEVNGTVVGSITHNGSVTIQDLSIAVNQGDIMNLNRTSSAGGGVIVGTIEVEYETNVELFRGPQGDTGDTGPAGLDGNSVITGGATPPVDPAPLQAAYFQTNGDVYLSENTNSWSFLFNIMPAAVLTAKYTNVAVTNVNTAGTFSGINTTPLFDQVGSSISVTSDTITILQNGTYELYFNLYQTGSTTRSNVGIEFVVNGTPTGRISASSYIRNSGGHNESSTNLRETFQLGVNDTLQINTIDLAGGGTVSAPVGASVLEIRKLA